MGLRSTTLPFWSLLEFIWAHAYICVFCCLTETLPRWSRFSLRKEYPQLVEINDTPWLGSQGKEFENYFWKSMAATFKMEDFYGRQLAPTSDMLLIWKQLFICCWYGSNFWYAFDMEATCDMLLIWKHMASTCGDEWHPVIGFTRQKFTSTRRPQLTEILFKKEPTRQTSQLIDL